MKRRIASCEACDEQECDLNSCSCSCHGLVVYDDDEFDADELGLDPEEEYDA